MTRIVTILTEGYADWETALLNAAARGFYGVETHFASPGGAAVVSGGGLSVQPDMALDDIAPEEFDAIIVNGGVAWSQPDAPDLSVLVTKALAAKTPIGAICDATLALAKTGVLDTIAHTSNGPNNLPGTGYGGASHYRDQPEAVRSGTIVTAPGTAPLSFMAEIMAAIGLADDNLAYYLSLHAAEAKALIRPAA